MLVLKYPTIGEEWSPNRVIVDRNLTSGANRWPPVFSGQTATVSRRDEQETTEMIKFRIAAIKLRLW